MTPTSERFLAAVELRPAEAETYDLAFTAMPQYVPWPKAYGGDTVAQALAAATASVPDDRVVHSMHSYFLRPVEVGLEVRYEVEIVRDGRGFSARQVRGYQSGKVVSAALLSFHTGAEANDVQSSMPDVPEPEAVLSATEALRGVSGDAAEYWRSGRSFDMRHVPGPIYVANDGDHEPRQAVWVRAFDTLVDDPAVHRLALAYVCDYTILEPALRALGTHWQAPGLSTASVDHAIWFHRPARADDWLLYAQEAASIGNGRALASGKFFDRSGRHIATVAQEGLILAP